MIKTSENKNKLFLSVHWNFNEMSTYSEGKEEIHEDTKNDSFLEQQNGNQDNDWECSY